MGARTDSALTPQSQAWLTPGGLGDLETTRDLKLKTLKLQQSDAFYFTLFGHADRPIFKETSKDHSGRSQDLGPATAEKRRGFLISAPVLGGHRPELGRWPSGTWLPPVSA